jgi:hypothetical protein
MKDLKKTVEMANHLFGLVIGDKFTTPQVLVLEKYPGIEFIR